MSVLKYQKAPKKDEDIFDDFMDNFQEAMTGVQDPEDAIGTLADLITKFNNLLASMRERGMIT
jgi:uncharacterized phage infection (PIP) family protein YhgE